MRKSKKYIIIFLATFLAFSVIPEKVEARHLDFLDEIKFPVDNMKSHFYDDWKERRGIKAYLHGLRNNVLMRPLGNVLYFMPPYVITKKEISFVSEIMKMS